MIIIIYTIDVVS